MLKAGKRVERLEGSLLPKSVATPEDTIFRKTLGVLSDEDVYSLRSAAVGVREGRDEVDPKGWTKFGRRLDGAAG
jgi:hypothetical protein